MPNRPGDVGSATFRVKRGRTVVCKGCLRLGLVMGVEEVGRHAGLCRHNTRFITENPVCHYTVRRVRNQHTDAIMIP